MTSKLCKWHNGYGCFKDSNNDDIPDVIEAKPSSSYGGASLSGWEARYNRRSSGDNPSDFAFSCDTIPPNSYVYFAAKNSSGERIVMTKGGYGDGMIGRCEDSFRI